MSPPLWPRASKFTSLAVNNFPIGKFMVEKWRLFERFIKELGRKENQGKLRESLG
jgi:hypothetical protein